MKKTVDNTLDVIATPEFWEELGPDLTAKLREAAHHIAREASAATMALFKQDVINVLKDASKPKPMFESAEAYFKAVSEEPPEKE